MKGFNNDAIFFFSKYDIFDTSPETVENNLERSSLDKCHGCLRFFFLISVSAFILITAFISRFSFHLILINLNPPTIFTSLNKFGGDTVNNTVPFEPAEVHIAWVWACFLVLVAPSVHIFLHHFLQICKKVNREVASSGKRITTHGNEESVYRLCCDTLIFQKQIYHKKWNQSQTENDSKKDKNDPQAKAKDNSDDDGQSKQTNRGDESNGDQKKKSENGSDSGKEDAQTKTAKDPQNDNQHNVSMLPKIAERQMFSNTTPH
jgi:hypothetical protein